MIKSFSKCSNQISGKKISQTPAGHCMSLPASTSIKIESSVLLVIIPSFGEMWSFSGAFCFQKASTPDFVAVSF